jgi:HEPN domain-containing protein
MMTVVGDADERRSSADGKAPAFVRDADHWLFRYSPKEWIRAAMKEMRLAEASYAQRNLRAGIAGCKRAAGMALNAALIVEPNATWKRTYVEHLQALAKDESVPRAVSDAARAILEAPAPSVNIVILRSPHADDKVLEAARDVIAHAFAVVTRHEG